MSTGYEYYLKCAEEAASEAAASSLVNVRERALRSEAAWRVMAERALHIRAERETARLHREEQLASQADGKIA